MLLADLTRRITERERRRLLFSLYPDTGPLRRELYPKHLEFFAAGLHHNERAFIGGNRVGKTYVVAYESTCHMIGHYPEWWVGRRFTHPVTCWASGVDAKAVRESLQPKLMGDAGAIGTGLIPGDSIHDTASRGGTADALDFALIRYKDSKSEFSRLVFKAYEQKRESYQASEADIMLFDEEPPMPIYTEGLTRTMSTEPGKPNGIVMGAFTPLLGLSETVMYFLPGGAMPTSEEERKRAWGW